MKTHKLNHMAVDRYGNTHHNLGPHPRKRLLELLGRSHADKVYIDGPDGLPKHAGYVIAGRWYDVYRVLPFHD